MAEEPRTERRQLIKDGAIETADGWTAHFRFREGKRPALVFLNGLGDSMGSWNFFADALEDRATLQVDLRGQGKSFHARKKTHPASDYRIPIPDQSRDLAKVLDQLGLDDVILCGYSYGGGVAIDFASRWPDRVTRLGLIVPFVIRLDHAFPLQRLFSWQWRALKSFVPHTVGATLERGYEEFLSAYMNQRYEKRLENPQARAVAVQLSHGIMAFNTFDVLSLLPEKSVTLLTSELDTLVPRSLYREFWARMPESKRHSWKRVADGEHLLIEQKPELVLEWLRSLSEEPDQGPA